MSKHLILLFISILLTSILVVAEPAFSSSVTTPSVPEFTLKFEAHPYDVPPTYSIDPYTGENVIAEEGYHVENKSITVTIKNQAFTSSFNGTNYYLFYNARVKGHFEEQWRQLYPLWGTIVISHMCPQASNSEYTTLSVSAEDYPSDAQIDVQVRAYLGYDSQVFVPGGGISDHGHYEDAIVLDETSDWSETQTITLSYPNPEICFVSPQNKTYTGNSVSLNFSVNEETSWIGYSLDGQNNVTLTENTLTLTGLANGLHYLTIYAKGTYPNTEASETIGFTINNESELQQLGWLILIVAGALIAVALVIGLRIRLSRKSKSRS